MASLSGDQTSINHAREQDLEADDRSDNDSALGDDTQSTTTSLSESIYNYRMEHGRTYHAYKDGQYVFPNDEREADRLDLQHHILQLTYRRLHLAPLKDPRYALDIGQPQFVPPNLKFVIDDAEDLWVNDHKFDYIHCRLMSGCFADVPRVIEQAYENLEPGGYLEFQDYGLPLRCADDTLEGTSLQKWGVLLCEAARNLGRPLGSEVTDSYRGWMEKAGFVDLDEQHFMWPSNTWPKDPYMKQLGHWNMVNILEGVEGFCLALLTRGLGWTKEEVDIFVGKVSTDIKDRKIHGYYPMPVVWGRKPFPGER